VVGLLDQDEGGVGEVVLDAHRRLTADRFHAGAVEAAQQDADDHLLLAWVDLVQLEHGALAGLEQLAQGDVVVVLEDAGLREAVQPPQDAVDAG